MSSTVEPPLGEVLAGARGATGLSLQETADRAGCSAAYVHKLEQDRVRTPSPRVLAGLARALGLDYGLVMARAGYETAGDESSTGPPVPRFSNAHIVELLEALAADVAEIRQGLDRLVARG